MEDFETNIPQEEVSAIKEQILAGLRRRYLTHKGDYIIHTALGRPAKALEAQRMMDECVSAYNAVEAGM